MNKPKISIITPSYNQGGYLEETILSIINQKYPNLEYVIIDGGSTDQSLKIIKKYEHQLAYWESTKDQGQAHAINKGFKRCSGDIITFCNSDDTYSDGTFHYIAHKWNEWKTSGACVGSFQYIDENSKKIGFPREPKLKMNGPTDLTLSSPGDYRLHQVSTFFTKHALDTVGRYVDENLEFVFDRELLYRVVNKYPIYLDERLLGAFRLHGRSKSVSKVIPFSKEFASLYRSKMNGNREDNIIRERLAKYHLYRGWIKKAKATTNIKNKMAYLLKAVKIRPHSLFELGYWSYWKKLLYKN